MEHQVFAKEVWLASIDGLDMPPREEVPDAVRDIDRRGSWNDRLIDALCDPPESFVMSSVIAHVLTYSAHRRQLVRRMLNGAVREMDHGDPIMWLRAQRGERA
jgi:AraC family transcriptional regulator